MICYKYVESESGKQLSIAIEFMPDLIGALLKQRKNMHSSRLYGPQVFRLSSSVGACGTKNPDEIVF